MPSNIVSRQVGLLVAIRHSLTCQSKPSQGAEGESEYGDDVLEEDELISEPDAMDVEVSISRRVYRIDATTQTTETRKVKASEKKQKRKDAESKLQAKRQEMDKAKVQPLSTPRVDIN